MDVEGIVAWRNKNDTARECCRVVAVVIVGGVKGVLQGMLKLVLQGVLVGLLHGV